MKALTTVLGMILGAAMLVSSMPTAQAVNVKTNAIDTFNLLSVRKAPKPLIETKAFGSWYCQKMFRRCEAGDQSACQLLDQNCL